MSTWKFQTWSIAPITSYRLPGENIFFFPRLQDTLKSTETQGLQRYLENPQWFETISHCSIVSKAISCCSIVSLCTELPNIWETAAVLRVAAGWIGFQEKQRHNPVAAAHLNCRFTRELADILFVRGGIGLARSSVCFPLTISIISSLSVDRGLANWPLSKPKS